MGTPTNHVEFTFENNEEGWNFFNPSLFASVNGSYNGGETSLDVTTHENMASFGFWESPIFVISDPLNGKATKGAAQIPISGLIGPQSLYRSVFTVRSESSNRSTVPTFRVRSSSYNFEQSDVLVVTSSGNGNLSPDGNGRDYVQFFTQPQGVNAFRLDFDVLNFDPSDAAVSTLGLTNVVVDSLQLPSSSGAQTTSYDFTGGDGHGFSPRNAAPTVDIPAEFSSTSGLSIRGTSQNRGGNGYITNGTIFGFWGAETAIPISGGSLYAATFTVRSSATNAQRAAVPTFRMRVNDSSLKYSAFVNIDSLNGTSRVPVDNAQETYVLYMQAPQQINGQSFVLSFDYLYTPESNDDPTIALILDNLTITRYTAGL